MNFKMARIINCGFVRLPNELLGARNVRVSFNLRGASSKPATLKVISSENRSQ